MSSHGGVCPFCGTEVPRQFNTCSNCGATYTTRLDGQRMIGVLLIGCFLAAFLGLLGYASVVPGGGIIGLIVGGGITVALLIYGAKELWIRRVG